MLDKQLAQKLSPLVNNPELWEALKEFLVYQRNLELQGLVVATSELEVYRRQGKVNSLDNLLKLKDSVNVARKEKDHE
jgi:hypothetical protein